MHNYYVAVTIIVTITTGGKKYHKVRLVKDYPVARFDISRTGEMFYTFSWIQTEGDLRDRKH